jgi:hypothetical protein
MSNTALSQSNAILELELNSVLVDVYGQILVAKQILPEKIRKNVHISMFPSSGI